MKAKKVFSLITILVNLSLILVIVIFLLTMFFQGIAFFNDRYFVSNSRGLSMVPAKNPGDIIVVKLGFENIKIGNVICFTNGSSLIGHRVVGIRRNPNLMFLTKGDSNKILDGWVKSEFVVGKEIFVFPTGFLIRMEGFCALFVILSLSCFIKIWLSARGWHFKLSCIDLTIFLILALMIFSLGRVF